MKDLDKTKEQLINELVELRQRIANLETLEARRRQTEEVLQSSKEFVETVMNSITDSISTVDTRDFRVIGANAAYFETLKTAEKEVIGKTCYELTHRLSEPCGPPDHLCPLLETVKTGRPSTVEHVHCDKEGNRIYVEISTHPMTNEKGEVHQVVHIARDITERKRTEEALQLSHQFLEIANRHSELNPLLKEFLGGIRNLTGCAAVGIRILDEKGNIPYEAYEGFSQIFYESESPLSIKSDQCMCINVIKGTADPKLPFYTQGGSFYMNGTTRFLATVSEEEKGRTRNVCNLSGYESVALVPIRLGNRILGLIHVADHQENMVPLEIVRVLEGVAMQLGAAIQRVWAEERLRQAHDELEGRVKERTAELVKANERLEQEIEERQRAQEALWESEHRYRNLFEESSDPVYIITREGKFISINQAASDLFGYPREELMGMNVQELHAHPEDRHRFQEAIEQKGSVREYELGLRKKDGTELHCLITSAVRRGNDGSVLGYQGIIRDITDRMRAEEEQALFQRRQEALWRIARLVDAGHRTLCDRVLVEIMDMTQSRYAFFGFLNQDESVMSLYSWSREALDDCQIQRKPIDYTISEAGLWGDAVRQRKTLIINDYHAEHPNKKGLPQGHVPLTRILVVPIFSYDHIVAIAAVANKRSDYEEEDVRQVEGFVTNVQVILERRKMEESLEESEKELRLLSSQLLTAQERERKRIAGEIHDGIGQSLTTIKFGVENALRQMDKGAARGSGEPLEAIIPLAQEAIEEVRRIQTDLRPPILDDLGILATIGWFCREFQAIYTGIRIEKQINIQENEVPELLKIVIYRVLQEAMNNIAKHSQADLVGLYLRKTDGSIELVIEDNGRGFDVEKALALDQARRGFGLSSMRERTELSGGAFSIESTGGKGTVVRALWQH